MDVEEAIGMVCIGREQPLEFDEAQEIVELLKRGEKYEAMWEELISQSLNLDVNQGLWNKMEIIRDITEKLEQKYFPKKDKEVKNEIKMG